MKTKLMKRFLGKYFLNHIFNALFLGTIDYDGLVGRVRGIFGCLGHPTLNVFVKGKNYFAGHFSAGQ